MTELITIKSGLSLPNHVIYDSPMGMHTVKLISLPLVAVTYGSYSGIINHSFAGCVPPERCFVPKIVTA